MRTHVGGRRNARSFGRCWPGAANDAEGPGPRKLPPRSRRWSARPIGGAPRMVLESPALQGGVRVLPDPPSQPSFFCSGTWELSARCSSRGQHVAVRFPSWTWEVWIRVGGSFGVFRGLQRKGRLTYREPSLLAASLSPGSTGSPLLGGASGPFRAGRIVRELGAWCSKWSLARS